MEQPPSDVIARVELFPGEILYQVARPYSEGQQELLKEGDTERLNALRDRILDAKNEIKEAGGWDLATQGQQKELADSLKNAVEPTDDAFRALRWKAYGPIRVQDEGGSNHLQRSEFFLRQVQAQLTQRVPYELARASIVTGIGCLEKMYVVGALAARCCREESESSPRKKKKRLFAQADALDQAAEDIHTSIGGLYDAAGYERTPLEGHELFHQAAKEGRRKALDALVDGDTSHKPVADGENSEKPSSPLNPMYARYEVDGVAWLVKFVRAMSSYHDGDLSPFLRIDRAHCVTISAVSEAMPIFAKMGGGASRALLPLLDPYKREMINRENRLIEEYKAKVGMLCR